MKNSLKNSKKDQILLCALKLFCEKGYNFTTVDDIVKKASCSHGLFYHYFSNKKEVFTAVSEMRGKTMMENFERVMAEDSNYIDKLYKLTDFAFSNTKKDELFAYKYYFFVSTVFAKAESGKLTERKPTNKYKMVDFFKVGIERGEFKNDLNPEECAKLFNSIIQGATLNFILCPKEFKKSFQFPSADFIVNIFKKGD